MALDRLERRPLIQGTGRWPLLLSLVGTAVADLIRYGTPARDALNAHLILLQAHGPTGLDEMSRGAFEGRLVAVTIEASLGASIWSSSGSTAS